MGEDKAWFVGTANDILYIINRPPRPSHDDMADIYDVQVIATINKCKGDKEAAILAASLELLEASELLEKAEHDRQFCEECQDCEELAPETCEFCFPVFDKARIMRRNAIAKARGQTHTKGERAP